MLHGTGLVQPDTAEITRFNKVHHGLGWWEQRSCECSQEPCTSDQFGPLSRVRVRLSAP